MPMALRAGPKPIPAARYCKLAPQLGLDSDLPPWSSRRSSRLSGTLEGSQGCWLESSGPNRSGTGPAPPRGGQRAEAKGFSRVAHGRAAAQWSSVGSLTWLTSPGYPTAPLRAACL